MPPELHEALEQISQIRGQLAQSETFRGYRAASVAATGAVAVLTSLAQMRWLADPAAHPLLFVTMWVSAAALCLVGGGAQILWQYLHCESPHQKATTRTVVAQLLPPITAGAVLAYILGHRGPQATAMLPGLWPMLVSLGVFASRRHLPRAIGWVGLYYLACGSAILYLLPGSAALEPWIMGVVFGIGQMAAALVLYWNLERHGKEEEIV